MKQGALTSINGTGGNAPLRDGTMPPLPEQGGGAAQQQAPQPPQPPSHAQTVAALRHFKAILDQLQGLLKNPELGRADLKSQIIDGVTKLVADRMMAPNTAVTELASVPPKPFDQKQWAVKHYQQTMQARDFVLAHHAAAFAGQPPQPAPSPDGHMDAMNSLMQGYSAGTPQ